MIDSNSNSQFQSAIESLSELQRRVERLEREAKSFRSFCGYLAILCTSVSIFSMVVKLVWG